jgi:hypothetical protein
VDCFNHFDQPHAINCEVHVSGDFWGEEFELAFAGFEGLTVRVGENPAERAGEPF